MTADASGAAADIITSMDDALARVAQLAQSAFDDVEGSAQGSADGMSEAARRAATTMSNALAGIDTSGLQNSLSETARLTAQVEDVARAAAAARRDETEAARAANRAEDELISTLQDVNATTEQVAQATQAAVTARRNADQATERATAATRDLTEAQQRLNTETRDGAEEASGWGDRVSGALGSVVGAAAGLAGVALGIEGITQAFEQMDVGNRIAAQLGDGIETAREYGELTGKIYAGNFGESLQDVEAALGAVAASWGRMGDVGEEELRSLTEKSLTFADVFGTDATEAIQTTSQMLVNGLAEDGTQAFDLLTRAFQKIPAAMRDELPGILDEYGTNFRALGFDGEAAFEMLVQAANGGAIVLDKTGDALKEFTILATDGSKATGEGFKALGLDAEEMARAVAAGGPPAQDALQKTAAKLLEIQDPAERAQAAIGLFGTPLEDLSVDQIPLFLKSLQGGQKMMDGFTGSTEEMAKTMAQGPAASLEAFKRAVQGAIVDKLGLATRYLMDNKWAMYALGGALAAAVVGFVAIRTAAAVSSIAMGIHAAATGAGTGALAANSIAMGAHAIASGAMKAATAVATAAQWALNSALLASPITWIVLGIAAVVAAVVLIATKTDWFQRLWRVCWDAIKSAAQAVWEGGLKSVVDGIVSGFQWIGDKATWLWQEAIQPTFSAIGDFIAGVWDVLVIIFNLWAASWEVVGNGLSLLWTNVIQPILGWIGEKFTWLNDNVIQPVVGWITGKIHDMGVGFQLAYDTLIRPVLDWIADKFRWLNDNVIQPVARWITDKIRDIAAGFGIFRDKVGEVVAWVGDKLAVLSRSFTSAKDKIVGVFSGAGKWLWDAGKNIIQGLLDGAGSLLSSIGNFFLDRIPGWIKDPFKKALGIASPSKVFRGFGIDIGSGLVAGIRSMHGQAAAATESPVRPSTPLRRARGRGAMAQVAIDAAPAADASSRRRANGRRRRSSAAGRLSLGGDVANQIEARARRDDPRRHRLRAATLPARLDGGSGVGGDRREPHHRADRGAVAGDHRDPDRDDRARRDDDRCRPRADQSGVVVGRRECPRRPHRHRVPGPRSDERGDREHRERVRDGRVEHRDAVVPRPGGHREPGAVRDLQRVQRRNRWHVELGQRSARDAEDGHLPIRFWAGGTVPGGGGPTADDVPAMLSSREFVAPVKMIEAVGGGSWSRGAGILDGMRRRVLGGGNMPSGPEGLFGRYAAGGVVQGTPAWESLKRGHAFAARHSGKPYVWGGSIGPSGVDELLQLRRSRTSSSATVPEVGDRRVPWRRWVAGADGERRWSDVALGSGVRLLDRGVPGAHGGHSRWSRGFAHGQCGVGRFARPGVLRRSGRRR